MNWNMEVDGLQVPPVDGRLFPYCGLVIDVATLEVGKERDWAVVGGGDTGMLFSSLLSFWRVTNVCTVIFNSLTVEFSRCPGMNFKRKVLSMFIFSSFFLFPD